jgi:predicted nucleic acid-binding protein
MKFYADTSFLYSYYSADVNSARADSWRQSNAVALPFTVLHRLELRNAIELAVFQKRATATEAAEVWKTVEADAIAGLLAEVSLSLADLFAKAQELVANHTAATGARSLDVLHVAAASLVGAEEVVTFDQRQSALALRLNLKVAAL